MVYIFDFNYRHQRQPAELKDLLGGKGANLAEMTSVLGLPVPPGFTIATTAHREYLRDNLDEALGAELKSAIVRLEESMSRSIGDSQDPLLVSVRSGSKYSMPGMMDSVLNLGLNDESVLGLAHQTGDARFAYDTYRRFIAMFAKIVLGISGDKFEKVFDRVKEACGETSDSKIPTQDLVNLVDEYKVIVEESTLETFPQEPMVQLEKAIEAIFRSWESPRATAYREREGISRDLGTAVNIQAMVFGNRDERSGTGVGFTRNPSTGERHAYGDFLFNAQGEDVVAGTRRTDDLNAIRTKLPAVAKQLAKTFDLLEHHYRDMCDTEFTIESGHLWMLQTRVGKRTGNAAIRMAVEMTRKSDLGISRKQAIERVTQDHLDQVMHPQFVTPLPQYIATGLGASPGAGVGRCVFNADAAVAASRRGEDVILVRMDTSPEDVDGMLYAQGILTARGGLVSHAAVVARGWGKPAVVGVTQLAVFEDFAVIAGHRVAEGDWISIDGTSGAIMLGNVPLIAATAPKELETLLGWADTICKNRFQVRANVDSGDDAALARTMGAKGIGLCRTEHMFLRQDRLPIVRRMLFADSVAEQDFALEELGRAQQLDFVSILQAMDGLPVTIRLLDPPLHEFLPPVQILACKEAMGQISTEDRKLLAAALSWSEINPMLGTRGVRLGMVRPGLYEMQVRALMEAVFERIADGGKPIVEIMIPFTVSKAELENARGWVTSAIREVEDLHNSHVPTIKIGTMIETPRAAILADHIATSADFFSFGTNDLTQMTYAFSRDDIESRLMGLYLENALIPHNPFESIDVEGVGTQIRNAISLGKGANSSLTFGVCGEHGGDPSSIGFFVGIGINYVSCSPYRIPSARLAAAHSILKESER